jgi:hypothetical protein
MHRQTCVIAIILLILTVVTKAGPYTEPGVNGYIGDDWRHADPCDSDANLNPMFRGWATGFKDYFPSDDDLTDYYGFYDFNDPCRALGPATGNVYDVVSLGDLDAGEIADGCAPGQITLLFGNPSIPNDPNHIRNVNGYDFVVFENAFLSTYTGGGSVSGEMFAELGYVEVSSDGVNFVRFPSVSLTAGSVGNYGTIEISNVFNLVGKHPNANGVCTGTPFDLSEIAGEPNVVSGLVDINNISYVRIVDIPGSGNFYDDAIEYVDPVTWPDWDYYSTSHQIYDAWPTLNPGGVDLEAIGVLHSQQYCGDINLDGIVDYEDLSILVSAWLKRFGQDGWVARCDLAEPKDYIIDILDYVVFANQWLKVEQWRSQ